MSGAPIQGVTHLRVRYGETDQMGFVYHPNYLVWCEIGRTELMRDLGCAYADIERAGIRLAVADASLRYIRAGRYDDQVRIVTTLDTVQSRMIGFSYDIMREDGELPELLARASTRLIAIDETGSPRRLPDELLERFRRGANA